MGEMIGKGWKLKLKGLIPETKSRDSFVKVFKVKAVFRVVYVCIRYVLFGDCQHFLRRGFTNDPHK